MDKKNTIIGVALLLAAMASFYFTARYGPKPPTPLPVTQAPAGTNKTEPAVPTSFTGSSGTSAAPTDGAVSQPALGPAEIVTLENDYLIVSLTNHGGAVDSIAL
jgi:YidC/Oxa1 family membrane protein insertase